MAKHGNTAVRRTKTTARRPAGKSAGVRQDAFGKSRRKNTGARRPVFSRKV